MSCGPSWRFLVMNDSIFRQDRGRATEVVVESLKGDGASRPGRWCWFGGDRLVGQRVCGSRSFGGAITTRHEREREDGKCQTDGDTPVAAMQLRSGWLICDAGRTSSRDPEWHGQSRSRSRASQHQRAITATVHPRSPEDRTRHQTSPVRQAKRTRGREKSAPCVWSVVLLIAGK